MTILICTSGEVGRETGSEQHAGAVPSFVVELLLADVAGGLGGARHGRHQVEILRTESTLDGVEPQHVSTAAVPRVIPRSTGSRQRPGHIAQTSTRSHPEMVGDMSLVTLNFDLSKIPFVRF